MQILPFLHYTLKLAVQYELVSVVVAQRKVEPEVKVDVQIDLLFQPSLMPEEELIV